MLLRLCYFFVTKKCAMLIFLFLYIPSMKANITTIIAPIDGPIIAKNFQ